MYLSVKIILKAKKNKGKCCQRMNRNDKKYKLLLSMYIMWVVKKIHK